MLMTGLRTVENQLIIQTILSVGVIAVLALLYAEYKGITRLKWVAKPLASIAFVCLALACGALESTYGLWILAGLILCLLGDVLLIPKNDTAFLGGMGAFALGHLSYVIAFSEIWGGVSTITMVIAAILLISFPLILRWLWPYLGAFRAPVAIYCLIIGAMTVMSFATTGPNGSSPYWLAAIGAVAFAISDIAVAKDQFIKPAFINKAWGLPLYFGAQMLLASSV